MEITSQQSRNTQRLRVGAGAWRWISCRCKSRSRCCKPRKIPGGACSCPRSTRASVSSLPCPPTRHHLSRSPQPLPGSAATTGGSSGALRAPRRRPTSPHSVGTWGLYPSGSVQQQFPWLPGAAWLSRSNPNRRTRVLPRTHSPGTSWCTGSPLGPSWSSCGPRNCRSCECSLWPRKCPKPRVILVE